MSEESCPVPAKACSGKNKKKAPKHTPFAGCLIIGFAGLMMLFSIGFTIYSLFRTDAELSKFTENTPRQPELVLASDYVSEFNDLTQRLEVFERKVLAGEASTLSLSTLDLNLAISAYDHFEPLRLTFKITSLTPEGAHIQISYPLNSGPLSKGQDRYVNGTMVGKPVLDTGVILVDVDSIQSPKGSVPSQFVDHISDHQITRPYLEHERLGKVMKKLTGVKLGADSLLLSYDPTKKTPGRQPMSKREKAKLRKQATISFGIIFSLFIASLAIFFQIRSKRRK